MEEFRYYSPEDVIYRNLRETAARMDMLRQQELAHLCELAHEIVSDIENSPDFVTSLQDIFPYEEAESRGLDDTRRCLAFCMEIQKQLESRMPIRTEFFFDEPEAVSDAASGRIAYQRSSYADAAYLRFASLLPAARAAYTHSFQAACEEVFNGFCEYCLLPLENSSEGLLNSFSRLIDGYRLKIAATCDITATDGMRTTRFALLRRDLLPTLRGKQNQLCFELSLPFGDRVSPAALLEAAAICGLKPTRLDSRPQSDAPEQPILHGVFRVDNGNLTAFLLYLSMQASLFEVIGLYPNEF